MKPTNLFYIAVMFLLSCTGPDNDAASERHTELIKIVNKMTMEEKVGMLHGKGKFVSGGVERLGIPDLKSTDGPLGVREEIQNDSWAPAGWDNDFATFFPAGGGLSSTWNLDLAYKFGVAIGEETRARDKDILLAPAVNLIRSPLGGRNFEYFSEDPFLNKKLAVPYVKGVQEQDVAACVKHYAINNQETLRGSIDVLADERTIREMYLPVFKATVTEGNALAMMSAYNKFRGEYLSENDYMLNQILRKEWGFEGIVISDWGAVHSTVGSALGGLDIEMGTELDDYSRWYFSDPLITAVEEGKVSEEIIDQKVLNILHVMNSINALGDSSSRKKGSLATQKHLDVAYDIAKESIILLENKNEILPIKESGVNRIAVIGDNARRKHANQGFGAGVKTKTEITPYEAIVSKFPKKDIEYAIGYREQYLDNDLDRSWGLPVDYAPDENLIAEAVAAAKKSDVAIVFAGSNRLVETEAEDRKTLRLPFGQEALIKAVSAANPNTIVVMIAGSPHDLSGVKEVVDGLIWSWFNGSMAGEAIVDVLFGDVNPSGKLPITFPEELRDSPAHATNSFPGGPDVVKYEEGILIGYRWFDTKKVEPQYPFGYGLSYTSFDYKNLELSSSVYSKDDAISVELSVENTGAMDGMEIVQIYVRKTDSDVLRPEKELKGFQKVFVQAGSEQKVRVEIPVSELAYYDETNGWTIEPGEYVLMAATSSRNIEEKVIFSVQ